MGIRRWSVARLAKATRRGAAPRARTALSNRRHLGLELLEARLCLSDVVGLLASPPSTAPLLVEDLGSQAAGEPAFDNAPLPWRGESFAGVKITGDPGPYRVGDVVEFVALADGGTGDCEYDFWRRPVDGAWTRVRDWGPDPAWLWDTSGAVAGEYEIRVGARPAGAVDGQVLDSVRVSIRENADQLWSRVIETYLADDLWSPRDGYDAAHYLMVPLHVAFSSGRQDWQGQFADYFQRMMDAGTLEDLTVNPRVHHMYLASRFVALAASAGRTELIPDGLVDLLYRQVENLWLVTRQINYVGAPFEGMRARLLWILSKPEVEQSYYSIVLGRQLFTMAIGADLRAYERATQTQDPRSWVLDDVLDVAERIFRQEVVYVEEGGWLFQPGVMTDYIEYQYAGHDEIAPDLPPAPVPGIAYDSSHSARWPLWLTSLAGAHPDGSPQRAYYDHLKRGLEVQFMDTVVVEPTDAFPAYRTTNYMDGCNGIFRYEYITQGENNGYGPYELSGTVSIGLWSFLDTERVRRMYAHMARQFPLPAEVVDVYVGPNTTRERHPLVALPAAHETGFFELISLLASQREPPDEVPSFGRIELARFTGEKLSGEENWYELTAGREGIVTVETFFRHADGDVNLDIYDETGELVASSRSTTDYERVDFAAAADERFYVKALGANPDVDFRLANLVAVDGDHVRIWGTADDDTFLVTAGPSLALSVGGVGYELAGARQLTLRGEEGADALVFGCDTADDYAELRPGSLDLASRDYEAHAEGVETIRVLSGGGTDVAALRDDADGTDTFKADPNGATLSGDGFSNRVVAFRYVHAYATAGGDDVAVLRDDPAGTDTFEAWPTMARLQGDGYYLRAKSFRWVHAYATPSGDDVAVLHDDPHGTDTFEAWPTMARLQGDGYYLRAKSFRWVHAYATPSGDDVAVLHDDPHGADTFKAWPTMAKLYGAEYYVRAKSFRWVHAYATAGSADVAVLYGSPGNDTLVGTARQGKLHGSGFYNRAVAFDRMHAHGLDGKGDVAVLYDAVLEAGKTGPSPPIGLGSILWLYETERIHLRRDPADGGDSTVDAIDEIFTAWWD